MIGTLGGVLHGLEGNLGTEAMVEAPGHGIAPGAPWLLRGHRPSSVCTSLKPYSAYTTSGEKAMNLIRLPRRFLDDHDERMWDDPDVPIVVRVRETARFAWVRRDDPGLVDLRSDAEYYADSAVPGGLSEGYEWTGRAAKTLLRILDEASASEVKGDKA